MERLKSGVTCSGLVGVLQSEERPDGQLMLYAGVVEQGLLLKLLELLRVEAEGVRPQIRPCMDERGAQRFCKRTVNLLFSSVSRPMRHRMAHTIQFLFVSSFHREGKGGQGRAIKK